MSWKRSLIGALALTLMAPVGCKKKSNTTEQNQSNSIGSAAPGATGSDTNPNQPNPTHAAQGQPMGSAAVGPTAGNQPVVGDAGVGDAGTGSAAAPAK